MAVNELTCPPMRRVKKTFACVVLSVSVVVLATPAGAYANGWHKSDRVVVGVGDSFTSGQGAPPFVVGTDTATNQCHRSEAAYPVVAAKLIGASSRNVACSGAKTTDLFAPFKSEQPQISRIAGATDIVVTVGGVDINALGSIASLPTPEQLAAVLKALNPALVNTYKALHAANPKARIYAVGYPSLFGTAPAPGCPLSQQQRVGVIAATQALDDAIKLAATQAKIKFVDAFNVFAGHELCTAQPWVNGIDPVNPSFSLHPTVAGQKAIAERVATSLKKGNCRHWFSA